jgi:hypothetical protein
MDQTIGLLKHFYEEDKLNMPGHVPEFSPAAALWAAHYLNTAIQLTMLRHIADEEVLSLLKPYPEPQSIDSVYSADLCFRFMKDVLSLAKGFAPDDVLVKCLNEQAKEWPFSSVGIHVENADESLLISHTALRIAYADRIIRFKAHDRLKNPVVIEQVKAALGDYAKEYWPSFPDHLNKALS